MMYTCVGVSHEIVSRQSIIAPTVSTCARFVYITWYIWEQDLHSM